LISDKDVSKRGLNIKYGIPEFINLNKNSRECVRGVFDDPNEQFLISITGENQADIMNNL